MACIIYAGAFWEDLPEDFRRSPWMSIDYEVGSKRGADGVVDSVVSAERSFVTSSFLTNGHMKLRTVVKKVEEALEALKNAAWSSRSIPDLNKCLQNVKAETSRLREGVPTFDDVQLRTPTPDKRRVEMSDNVEKLSFIITDLPEAKKRGRPQSRFGSLPPKPAKDIPKKQLFQKTDDTDPDRRPRSASEDPADDPDDPSTRPRKALKRKTKGWCLTGFQIP